MPMGFHLMTVGDAVIPLALKEHSVTEQSRWPLGK